MKNRLIIDGNAVYEIDEECMKKKNEEEKDSVKTKERHIKKMKKRYR